MNGTSFFRCWKFLAILTYVVIVCRVQAIEDGTLKIGCQKRSTSGRDYGGEANTTVGGITCQKWSDSQPHNHPFTDVGDHNFCRNPNGAPGGVWCLTTDPRVVWQKCSVPLCPLKALDLSLDNDWKPDENNSYTHASLHIKHRKNCECCHSL